MAPRKAPAAKAAPKPKTAPKATPKSRKRAPPAFTSQAARKRRLPTCSMASLRELENEETIEEDFVCRFGQSSDSHFTWGKTQSTPIAAVTRPRRKRQFTAKDLLGFSRGIFGPVAEDAPEPIVLNSPGRSPFLRLPLEIREMIYSRCLIFRRPVILRDDWKTVEDVVYRPKKNNALIFVCQQINIEATSFLFKYNVFRTILRPPPSNFLHRDALTIDARFVSLMKNVILTCEKENYHLEWFTKACSSVQKLADANVFLDTLTIVVFPQKVGMSSTAVGLEANPVTFADFFYAQGQFMIEIRKLHCKFLNIVMKKIDLKDMDVSDNHWRVLISIDMRDLRAADIAGSLVNPETMKMAKWRAELVESELRELRNRFEDVFEDDERAMEEGKCVMLDEHESCDNGMELAANYFGFGDEIE